MNGRSSNRFIVYGEVFLTIQINAFLYYLSRMPVLGKIVHGTWYGCYRLKKLCSLFGLALGFVRSALAGNLGALVLLYGLPHLFLRRDALTTGVFLMLFVLLKCVCSVPAGCGLFHSSEEDHAFLNHFCVNPACYYRYKALKEVFFSGFMLFPAVYFLFRNWGLTIALVLLKLCSVLLGNVVYLQFYKMYGRLPGRRARRWGMLLLCVLGYAGAYLGWYRDAALPPSGQWALGIVCAILSVLCWIYHLQYSDYKRIAVKFADPAAVSFHISVQRSSMGEETEGLSESGWKENRDFFDLHRENAPEKYLELAFSNRFGKALRREKRDRVLVMLLAGAVLGLGIRFGWLPVTSDNVLEFSPVLISLALSLSSGGRLMQIYFRNIDMHMLYHHMATPAFIRSSMLQRYLCLLKGNLLLSAVILGNTLLMLILSGLSLPVETVAGLVAVCILFLMLWDTYECILYYILQPYSADLTVKSPVFKALAYLEGAFWLLVLLVRRDLTEALPWVSAAGAASAAAFFISRQFAPKTFRLR